MKILKSVDYAEVEEFFKTNHPAHDSPGFQTNDWALDHAISGANTKCNGIWSYVELETEEVLNIFLPWHQFDCEENNPVIPPHTKMNVRNTAFKIKSDEIYPSRNPICWSKINYWMQQEEIGPLFLSTQPVQNLPEHDAYRDLENEQGHLFHLDGFHRMISWGIKEQNSRVHAFVAGVR